MSCLALVLALPLQARAADTYKIGLMCPMTGKWASEGLDMKNIVDLQVKKANEQGGINGKKIEVVVEDDAGDPRSAALAAQKLASSDVKAVIGTYGSAVTEASQNIYDEAGILQIATGSTSIRLSEKNLPLFFRTCPRDDAQGSFAAEQLLKKGFKRIALLHDNSSYAKGLADQTKKCLEGKGVEIVFFDALTAGERDYTATLTKLKAANPDVIFFTGYYPEAGMLLRQKKEMGWNVPMMGGDASNHADLVKVAGNEAAKGYFFVSPPLPQDMDTPEAKAFLKDYQAAYHAQPVSVWAVLAGDAYIAIEDAGKYDPEDMAKYLKTMKDKPALSGKMGFNEKGDRVGDFYRIYEVEDGGRFVLQPKN